MNRDRVDNVSRVLAPLLGAPFVALLLVAGSGCGGGGAAPESATYEELVTSGWDAFHAGDFGAANLHFNEAAALDTTRADAYLGLGWAAILDHRVDAADQAFGVGVGRSGAGAQRADLFAGWAFATAVLADTSGAGLDRYAHSNARADSALAIDPGWDLEFLPSVDHDDLRLLEAQNYFILGEFETSLGLVHLFDPLFTANTSTREGQAALSSKIETLTFAHASFMRLR